MSDLIRLPSERVTQLRELSRNLGLTVSDTVAHMLNQEIEAGRLSDTVPGFSVVSSVDNQISLEIECDDGRIEIAVDRESALLIAERMDHAASRQNPFTVVEKGVSLIVARAGAGVRLSNPGGKFERMLAPSLARDVARLIRKAAQVE